MNRFDRIQALVQKHLEPLHFELENESSKHSVPAGSETHFKILIVSDIFESLSRVDRQRKVHAILEEELKTGLHALTIRALSSKEWRTQSEATFASPECQGGSRAKTSNS